MGEATELAVAAARRDASDPHHPPPPAPLRPILRFHGRLAPRARSTVRDVLDADPAFRERVAADIDEASVERSTWLFLVRPEGWEEELALLADAVADETARADAARQEHTAARRVEHLESALDRARSEVEQLRAELDVERERRRRTEQDAAAARDELAAREAERAVTVRHLAEARRQAEERLARIQELERSGGSGPPTGAGSDGPPAPVPTPPEPGPWDGADPGAVDAALRRAADTVGELGRFLDDARRALSPAPADGAPAAAPDAASGAVAPRPRRSPVRLTRGALEGDADGVDQLLRTPGMVVLVDGYNVTMAGWPELTAATQRDRLVALLSDATTRTGADVRVVFDGDDDGRRPAVSVPLAVRVHFTPAGVEADDVILDMVGRLPAERPVTVVSSDRRVQDGARPKGANVVPSEALLRWYRR